METKKIKKAQGRAIKKQVKLFTGKNLDDISNMLKRANRVIKSQWFLIWGLSFLCAGLLVVSLYLGLAR